MPPEKTIVRISILRQLRNAAKIRRLARHGHLLGTLLDDAILGWLQAHLPAPAVYIGEIASAHATQWNHTDIH